MQQSAAFIGQESVRQSFGAAAHPFGNLMREARAPQREDMTEELLPFTVRLAAAEADVEKAVRVRHAAYARHVPLMAEKLRAPEATDFEDGVAVLLAESKLDGAPLGTMRIQTNRFKPLSIEQSIDLPDWLQGRPLAEATRLGVEQGRMGTFVKTVLFKAFYRYCMDAGISHMVIAARSPLDRQYDQLMFADIYPERGFIPMRHGGNIPHRALCLDVACAEQNWKAAAHPMFAFMTQTRHPDIDVSVHSARRHQVEVEALAGFRTGARVPSFMPQGAIA